MVKAETCVPPVMPRYFMSCGTVNPSISNCRLRVLIALLNVNDVRLRPRCSGMALLGLPIVRCRRSDRNGPAVKVVSANLIGHEIATQKWYMLLHRPRPLISYTARMPRVRIR